MPYLDRDTNARAVFLVDLNGNPMVASGASGPQPASSSQSVTPASDSASFPTVSRGSSGLSTSQVSVGASATQIVAARANRGSVKITNLGTNDVYIGTSGVTVSTGDLLPGTKGASIVVPTTAALFGVAGTAQNVSVLEVF